ncbi:hypothetical protein HYV89_04990 [Candidatus Woesearchaeota archaeon]|nr:hypothetical protein [Candidatus Woesearchaeota archaeon]
MNRNKYKRLSQEEKDGIKEFTLKGKSLRQVSKILGIGITTIYYHVRKFKPKQFKKMEITLKDFQLGELIGSFVGDGNFYYDRNGRSRRYVIRYYLSYEDDRPYSRYLVKLLKNMNLNTRVLCRKNQGRLSSIEIRIYSKEFYNLLREYITWEGIKTYSVRLLRGINDYSEDFLKGFIRGLMDTDGFVENYNLSLGVTSKPLILNFEDILSKFDIQYKLTIRKRDSTRKDLFLCRIHRVSLELYRDLFGFSNPRKMNGLLNILK